MSLASSRTEEGELIPWYVSGAVALICSFVLIAMAILGPLGTGAIVHRTSQSGVWQVMGQDLADLLLLAPLLLIGGALRLMRRGSAKYFLVLTPLTLMYTGLSLGVGQEWSVYDGNVEEYFWMFLTLVVGGLILLISVLSSFRPTDGPGPEGGRFTAFAAVMGLVLLIFAGMWLGQIEEVIGSGDLPANSYSEAPNVFWTVRFLDLGICVPLGIISLFLLLRRPARGYPLVLLFFGFFLTMALAVNAMAAVQLVNDDPAMDAVGTGLLVFPAMALLFLMGLVHLLRRRGPSCEARGGER